MALMRAAQYRHPSDFWINSDLAVIPGLADRTDAIRFATVALAIRPTGPGYDRFAWLLTQSGRQDEAIEIYKEGIRRWPKIPNLHAGYGLALHRKGRLDEAVLALLEALRLDPSYGQAYVWLGDVLLTQGKVEEAIGRYQERARFRTFSFTGTHLFHALLKKGSPDDAASIRRRMLEVASRSADSSRDDRWVVAQLLQSLIQADLSDRQTREGGGRMDLQRIEDEKALLSKAIQLCRALVAEVPVNSDYRNGLVALEKLQAQHFGKKDQEKQPAP
jgi:hypothetical protein